MWFLFFLGYLILLARADGWRLDGFSPEMGIFFPYRIFIRRRAS
jgi:hypothetical protein